MTREIKLTRRECTGEKVFVRNIIDALCSDEYLVAARWQNGDKVFAAYAYQDEQARTQLEIQADAPINDRVSLMALRNYIMENYGEEMAFSATRIP